MSKKDFNLVASRYYKLKKMKEKFDENFENSKAEFYSYMDKYWSKNKIQDNVVSNNLFSITRVQQVKINFNVNKLKKKMPKELIPDIIKKKAEIVDLSGLIAYLKSCGVNPTEFKKYINVTEDVDIKAFNKLEQLGKIDVENLSGCYSVEVKNPYFKIADLRKEDEATK